jgi:hypothetical protein
MKLLRNVVLGVMALALLAAAGVFALRFVHEGPLGMFPGGPLRGGDLFAFPVSDWSFAADVKEIELQLASQRISRTTWILVRDGAAYVPSGGSARWPALAQRDGRALLRIEGTRYPVTLAQDEDPTLLEFARAEVQRKYGRAPSTDGEVVFFKVKSRAAQGGE